MKICADCRYYHVATTCNHPNLGVSIVTGVVHPKFAIDIRNSMRHCSLDAKWFESKVTTEPPIKTATKKPWYKFWSFNA